MRHRRWVIAAALLAFAAVAPVTAPAAAAPEPWWATRWWCDANDPLPHDDMTDQQMEDEERFYPEPKGRLTRADCRRLTKALVAARRYAMQFPTAADARRGGFRMIVPYVHGMGAHYVGPQGIGGTIDPRRPNFLLYGGNGPDAPLVGLMWIAFSGDAPPADGLPGRNDHFHRHGDLCMVNGLIIAEGLTDEECAEQGGFNIDTSSLWMLHAWNIPGWKYKPDVFRPHHPRLEHEPPT
jgi:hypothetical protein